jgi:hypothetical protein
VGVAKERSFTMKSPSVPVIGLEAGVRWAARTAAVLALALIVLPIVVNSIYDIIHGFYAGGMPHSLKITGVEPMEAIFIWVVCIGLVVAWRWAMIGGVICLAGIILLFSVALIVRGAPPGGFLSYLMLLPGILFVADAFIRRHMAAR